MPALSRLLRWRHTCSLFARLPLLSWFLGLRGLAALFSCRHALMPTCSLKCLLMLSLLREAGGRYPAV